MSTRYDPAELFSMLRWHQANGVNIAVREDAQDRFAEIKHVPSNVRQSQAPSQGKTDTSRATQTAATPAILPSADVEEAKKIAGACADMDALRKAYSAFEGCPLKLRATQIVFSDGNPQADIMLIGEAPGHDEDLQGKPFVGRAGHLLDRMLASIGLDREKVFIVNTVPWRPPGNRNPSPAEITACRPFLDRQVQLAAPKLIMTLGLVATQALFGEKISITRTRGQWRDVAFGDFTAPVLPTLHPAFLLRQPRQKREAWKDLLALKAAISALDADETD